MRETARKKSPNFAGAVALFVFSRQRARVNQPLLARGERAESREKLDFKLKTFLLIHFHSLGLTLLIHLVARKQLLLWPSAVLSAGREVLTLIRFIFRLYRAGVAIIWYLRWMIGTYLIAIRTTGAISHFDDDAYREQLCIVKRRREEEDEIISMCLEISLDC